MEWRVYCAFFSDLLIPLFLSLRETGVMMTELSHILLNVRKGLIMGMIHELNFLLIIYIWDFLKIYLWKA